jgi:ABC-type dipeptide/oligopeptide/nickel transport system ATPase component
MIVLNDLPKEIRDKIELREASDPTFYRFIDEDYTEIFWNILTERADVTKEHSVICSVVGEQGSGKSWSAIAMCHFMDPNFSHDKIFFSYNDLVHYRAKLKPHSAVLLDEQTQSYGLDSNRVMIMLQSIKEQLRKKSIHLFFCSPVLHPESSTSMYIIEVLFVDKETSEAYACLKTRDGQTLGHIRIPSPLKPLEDGKPLATEEFMERYETVKDEHLEKLLGQRHVDVFEDRADAVMTSKLFKTAEKVYVKKLGYIPRDRVVQIINKLFPEYNAGVVPQEIAERIRMNRELAGKWLIPGSRKSRNK